MSGHSSEERVYILSSFYDSLSEQLNRIDGKILEEKEISNLEVLALTDDTPEVPSSGCIGRFKRKIGRFKRKIKDYFIDFGKTIKAAYWEIRKIPNMLRKNCCFLCEVLLGIFVFILAFTQLNFSFSLLTLKMSWRCLLLIVIAVCIACLIIAPWRSFSPKRKSTFSSKGSKYTMTVFFTKEVENKGSSSFVLALSVKETYENDDDKTKNDQLMVAVVIDNFTARKMGTHGIETAGSLLVPLSDCINSVSRKEKKMKINACIQYHVSSDKLEKKYFETIKKNLDITPELVKTNCFGLKTYTVKLELGAESRAKAIGSDQKRTYRGI